MNIKIYTDGACSGNPGPGGWACILSTVLGNGQPYEVKHCGGCRLTTNNRMELLSVINGLAHVNGAGHSIEVISDSKYVCDAFNQHWIDGWRKNGFNKKGGLKNRDMWMQLWELVCEKGTVKFTWIKGHAGHSYNEECDRLAVMSYNDTPNLTVDVAYESGLV